MHAGGCGVSVVGGAPEADAAPGSSSSSGSSGGGPNERGAPRDLGDGAVELADGAIVPKEDASVPTTQPCPDGTVCDVIVSANVLDVAVSGSALYWLESTGEVKTAQVDGTGAHTIVSNEATPLAGIEANSQYVLWTAGGKLRRAEVSGSGPTSLFSHRGGCLRWRNATTLLGPDLVTGDILAIDPTNGASTQVTVSASEPWGVAPLSAAGPDFFYTNYDASSGKIRKGNGNLTTSNPTLLSNQSGPRCMATDGTSVWWANRDSNTLVKATIGMQNVAAFVSNQPLVSGVALDATYVYWSSQAGIRRRTK